MEMNIIKRKLNILKKRKIDKKLDNFFNWIKGAELVELKECNTNEDPVRPELDNNFRRNYFHGIVHWYYIIYILEHFSSI